MLLHSFNNLTAVMLKAAPEDVVLPINRLGTTLALVSNHPTLALYIGHAETQPSESLLMLKDLTNRINHLMASSFWSWRWSR
jgi:hypothetical protein